MSSEGQFGQRLELSPDAESFEVICSESEDEDTTSAAELLEADLSEADLSEAALSMEWLSDAALSMEWLWGVGDAGRKSATVTDLLVGALALPLSREATTLGGKVSSSGEALLLVEALLELWPFDWPPKEKRDLHPLAKRRATFAKVEGDGPDCMSGH